MTKETDHINLKSDEVQEILGKMPSWLTRWGISVVFICLVALIAVGFIVQYPEVVSADVEITSDKPPAPIYAKISGNLERLLIAEGDSVKKGQLLGVIANTLNEDDLLDIEAKLNKFIENPSENYDINFSEAPELGALQEPFSTFLSYFNDYQFFNTENTNLESIGYIEDQIDQIYSINKKLERQKKDCTTELGILQTNLNTDRSLFDRGIISEREFQKTEANYFNKKSACDGITIQIASNEMNIQELKMDIFGLSSGEKESDLQKFTLLRESANQLNSQIKLWKEEFLLVAPIDGIVSLNNIWSDNQYINQNEEVISIFQRGGNIKAIASLSNNSIGKVRIGQEVNIKFPTYNYMQFGMVKGSVLNISAIPRNNAYQIEIGLPNGLLTTYNKTLDFQQGMLGNAEIITEKRSFMARILDKFKFLISEK